MQVKVCRSSISVPVSTNHCYRGWNGGVFACLIAVSALSTPWAAPRDPRLRPWISIIHSLSVRWVYLRGIFAVRYAH